MLQQRRHLHNSTRTATALNRKQCHCKQAALFKMSSSPKPPYPEEVSCPPQLSEQSIAQLMPDLPLLDEPLVP